MARYTSKFICGCQYATDTGKQHSHCAVVALSVQHKSCLNYLRVATSKSSAAACMEEHVHIAFAV